MQIMEKLRKCLKNELSIKKANTLVSLIAFKLEELLPTAIQNSVSQAYPNIVKGVNKAIEDSLPSIENSLTVGLKELKILQKDLSSALKDLQNYHQCEPERSLNEMLIEKDVEGIKKLVKNRKIIEMIQELEEDDLILLGDVLFQLGCERDVVEVFEEVCERVSVKSERFVEFYMKVCCCSDLALRNVQRILESKF